MRKAKKVVHIHVHTCEQLRNLHSLCLIENTTPTPISRGFINVGARTGPYHTIYIIGGQKKKPVNLFPPISNVYNLDML